MADTCATCNAWVPGKDVTIGRCKAHPPLPLFGAHAGQPGSGVPEPEYYYPVTTSGDWCREHAAVAAATEVSPFA